jgi:hypothetical protein
MGDLEFPERVETRSRGARVGELHTVAVAGADRNGGVAPEKPDGASDTRQQKKPDKYATCYPRDTAVPGPWYISQCGVAVRHRPSVSRPECESWKVDHTHVCVMSGLIF